MFTEDGHVRGDQNEKFAIEGHEPSLPLEEKNWKLVWSDEFDGSTLDESKWIFGSVCFTSLIPRIPEKGVKVENGNLILSVTEENGRCYFPQLQTDENYYLDRPNEGSEWPVAKFRKSKFMHRYSYYEILARLQKQKG